MNYWWVNHKQTRDQEVRGGYLWSPKRNANGAFNQTYHNMTLAQPGDVVFSYAGGRIGSVGRVTDRARSAPKPREFGSAGEYWSDDGWLLPVRFDESVRSVTPKAHLDRIARLLPTKHSPIRPDGNGNQGVYLASISSELGRVLSHIAGTQDGGVEVQAVDETVLQDLEDIESAPGITSTEREQLSRARVGQGLFRARVIALEGCCRVTGVDLPGLLRASHIKPWRLSSNAERLDGNNGLLLAPHVDLLFDGGLISFGDEGALIVSPRLPRSVLDQWRIPVSLNVGGFNAYQRSYMAFHRTAVLRS